MPPADCARGNPDNNPRQYENKPAGLNQDLPLRGWVVNPEPPPGLYDVRNATSATFRWELGGGISSIGEYKVCYRLYGAGATNWTQVSNSTLMVIAYQGPGDAKTASTVVSAAVGVVVATSVATAVGASVSASVASSTGAAVASSSGAAAGGGSIQQGGNVMGVISQAQFMNLCAAGDIGVPEETTEMADGVGWVNLQFAPPVDVGGSRKGGRALLGLGSSCEKTSLLYDKKACSKDNFMATIFYNAIGVIAVGLGHYIVLATLEWYINKPISVLPATIQYPTWELQTALASWNPLALCTTMVFARYRIDFYEDTEHVGLVIAALMVALMLQLPFLVYTSWFVYVNTSGSNPSCAFVKSPFKTILATRPSFKWPDATEDWTAVPRIWLSWLCDIFCWFVCFPLNIQFQGAWENIDDAPVSSFFELYGALFQNFSPANGYGHMYNSVDLFKKAMVLWLLSFTIVSPDPAYTPQANDSLF